MMGTDTNERENKDLAAKEHRERKAETKQGGGWKVGLEFGFVFRSEVRGAGSGSIDFIRVCEVGFGFVP